MPDRQNPPSYPPWLLDSHCHLCSHAFDPDRGLVLQRAAAAGIRRIIAVGETLVDAEKNLALADQHEMVLAAAGLAPEHLDLSAAEALVSFIRQHHAKLVAVGEVGLDYWRAREENDRAVQREIFTAFIHCASQHDLPLNVHSRSAGRQTIELLLTNSASRVQMHAFDGKASAAMLGVEAGYFFSLPPSVVRSRQKEKLLTHLPLSCLLAETDSPVLGPEPGIRNEPANLGMVIDAIARIKKIDPAEVAQALADNSRHLYGTMPL